MTINDLNKAWNDLRNAALGKGTHPNVPKALAERLGRAYEQWRTFFEGRHFSADDLNMPAITFSDETSNWLDIYRRFILEVKHAGIDLTTVELPPDAGEKAVANLGNFLGDAKYIAVALLVVLGGALAYKIGRK